MSVSSPALRLVALGASNLTRDLAAIEAHLRAAANGPVEVLAACGHGRSFGMDSRYLGLRVLPGMLDCGLWQELAERPSARAVALLTDIGNDVAYGARAETVAAWVEACLDRLAGLGVAPVVVLPPVTVLASLPVWQFRAASWLLFPGRGLSQGAVIDGVGEVARRVEGLAEARGLPTIRPRESWYGIDPIHLHRAGRRAMRAALHRAWELPSPSVGAPWRRRLAIRTASAAEARWAAVAVRSAQPARRFADGSTLSLY